MKTSDALFLVCVFAVAALFIFATLTRTETAAPSAASPPAAGEGGRPRDVDSSRIRTMIERGELSDHEAEFYRAAPSEPEKRDPSTPQ